MTECKIIDFLITYDHDARKQISLEEFRNTAQALRAYSEHEEQYRDNPRVEVVLLGAESIDAIKVTHSNYFEDTADAFANLLSLLGLDPVPAEQALAPILHGVGGGGGWFETGMPF